MYRRQPIDPPVVYHLRHDTVIDIISTCVPGYNGFEYYCTFESEFGRFIHDDKLDNKSMSLEVWN